MSSLDNITNNKIIFDKRTKKIIDNNLNNELCTLTLSQSSRENLIKDNNNANNIWFNEYLISKRINGNNSFEKNIYSLVHYQSRKKIENKKIKKDNNKNNQSQRKKILNSPISHKPYIGKIIKKKQSKR